jgi:hypothetical protein
MLSARKLEGVLNYIREIEEKKTWDVKRKVKVKYNISLVYTKKKIKHPLIY